MKISRAELSGYRTFEDVSIVFDKQLTIVTGENGVGKTSLIDGLITGTNLAVGAGLISPNFTEDDLPYGRESRTRFLVEFEFAPSEIVELFAEDWPPAGVASPVRPLFERWLSQVGDNALTLTFDRHGLRTRAVGWSGRELAGTELLRQPAQSRLAAVQHFLGLAAMNLDGETLNRSLSEIDPDVLELPHEPINAIRRHIATRLKRIGEFRMPIQRGSDANAIETLTGMETADVLLNLFVSGNSEERIRYESVKSAFSDLFLRYTFDVFRTPGQAADIHFFESRNNGRVRSHQISAGVQQGLALLTNIIGRKGNVIIIEHPESFFHPQAVRSLVNYIRQASSDNQFIVVTHDVHFINPTLFSSLRRVWWRPEDGTKITAAPTGISPREAGQITRALRRISSREAVLARAVLLVEGESDEAFIRALAPRLDRDLDSAGVSVVHFEGQDGYKPYLQLLEALQIPVIALRDLNWGDDHRYPAQQFHALGAEIEDYLSEHGFQDALDSARAKVGRSKPRICEEVALTVDTTSLPPLFDEVIQAAIEAAGV